MSEDEIERLVASLRKMKAVESIEFDREAEVVMAGAGTTTDPFYEPEAWRQMRPSKRVTITIKGEF